MGMDPTGYPSDVEGSNYDGGFGDCRPPGPAPDVRRRRGHPARGVPRLPYAPQAALANLAKLKANFDAYGPGGFYDAVAVRSGTVARRYLALDQGMIMGALGNALAHDDIRRGFVTPQIEHALRPLLSVERFNV